MPVPSINFIIQYRLYTLSQQRPECFRMNGDLMWIRYFKATIIGLSLTTSLAAQADTVYPTQPLASVTPGVLCSEPDSFRYAEHIPYCERDVNSKMKKP